MHILVCDDDAAFAAQMDEYISEWFRAREIQVQSTVCTSGEQLLATPELERYQLAFLDVDLKTTDGIALGRKLRQIAPDIVLVYISAYLEFAPQGYTVNAYRYLLKRDIAAQLPSCLEDIFSGMSDPRKTLEVHHNRTTSEIPLDQIYYLESDLRQINVYGDIPHQPICTFYGKIADLPAMLYENGFLQVGRSDVVNLQYVRSIRNYKVHLCIVAMFNDQVMQRRSLHFQAELEQQRASALLDSYTAQRRLTHEFTNHIGALRALLAQGDVAGAQDYIAGVDKAVAASTTIMDTHNPLLDSILTRKYEEATRQGVSVYFDLCDLRDFPLSGVDMVTVLANLLDNAICAAAQAYPPEVYVRVRKTEEEYLLSVRNRVQRDVELPPDGQLPRTTRKEPGHGMGLSNVRDVLLRHGAEYTLSCRDNWFRFTCAVPTGNS